MNYIKSEIEAIEIAKDKELKIKNINKLKTKELINVLLGNKEIPEKDLSRVSTKICSVLEKNQEPTIDDMKNIRGLNPNTVPMILAAIELGKRCSKKMKGDLSTTKPSEIAKELMDIRRSKKEHFVIFFLNTRDKEIKREIVSIGTVSASLVHPREVFSSAIECGASLIIGAHNHPSGKADPSDADIYITQRLVEAGRVLGIEFYDHIIVTKTKHLSIREENPDLFD